MKAKRRKPETESRRRVLRGLATGLAGAVAVPSVAAEQEASAGAQEAREASATSPAGPAGLLDTAEQATLGSLCEALVPGSVAAGAPELLDRVARVETPDSRRELVDALRAFEGEARLRHARRWVELDDVARREILERAAAAPDTRLHEHLLLLRDRVANAYFATERGMEQLGWTRRSAWRELPGCDHPGDDHR